MRINLQLFGIVAALALATSALSTVASAEEITSASSVAKGDAGEVDDVQWVGIATSPRTGRVFKSVLKGYEQTAKAAAIAECERATGSTCLPAIAVPNGWAVVVLRCGGKMFPAGSNTRNEWENAYGKAADAGFSRSSCHAVGTN